MVLLWVRAEKLQALPARSTNSKRAAMLTDEQRADHERAATALETHENRSCTKWEGWEHVLYKAWGRVGWGKKGIVNAGFDRDARAARLLRECIEKGEPLP
jgi:hypothetical protein